MKTGYETFLITLLACAIILQVNGWTHKSNLQKDKDSSGKKKEKIIDNGKGTQDVSLSIQGWDEYGIPQNLTVPLLKKILELLAAFNRKEFCPKEFIAGCTVDTPIKSFMPVIIAYAVKIAKWSANDDDYDDEMASSGTSKYAIKVGGTEEAPEDDDEKIQEEYPKKEDLFGKYSNLHIDSKYKKQKYIKNMGPFEGTLTL